MVQFQTDKLQVQATPQKVEFYGNWRKRGSQRLFTEEQIRRMRNLKDAGASFRSIGEMFDCSHVLVYQVVKRSIYEDII